MSQSYIACPICEKRVDPASPHAVVPFCSRRCQQIDLGNWLDEAYGLPADGQEDTVDCDGWQDGGPAGWQEPDES